MSMALIKRDLKVNLKLWLVITGVMSLLLFAILYAMFGHEGGSVMILYQFFTLFAAVLPLFYIAVCAKRLIAEQIDSGSFSYVMSAPIKRAIVTVTQAVFLIVSVALMYLTIFLLGLIAFSAWEKVVEVSSFFMLTFGSFLLNLAISGIAFFASCLFNSSAKAAALGIGMPMAFFHSLYYFGVFGEQRAACKV